MSLPGGAACPRERRERAHGARRGGGPRRYSGRVEVRLAHRRPTLRQLSARSRRPCSAARKFIGTSSPRSRMPLERRSVADLPTAPLRPCMCGAPERQADPRPRRARKKRYPMHAPPAPGRAGGTSLRAPGAPVAWDRRANAYETAQDRSRTPWSMWLALPWVWRRCARGRAEAGAATPRHMPHTCTA